MFLAEQPRDDGTVLRQAAVAIAVAGNFASIADAQQVQMEKVVRNKAAGDIWISMPNGSVIVSSVDGATTQFMFVDQLFLCRDSDPMSLLPTESASF